MTRLDDWPERLFEVIDEARHKPFKWGEWDCTTFAAACVEAMTGEDPMSEFRDRYEDEESGKEALKELGGGSLYSVLKRKFGKPVPVAFAQRGDLALAKTEQGPTVFVVLGEKMVGPGDEGLEAVPRSGRAFCV